MNKLLLTFVNLLPEPLLIKFVRFYVDFQIKKHARLDVKGLENLDGNFKRPYLIVCNHLSNSDGLVLNKVLEKEKIIFVAGKKLESNTLTNLGFKIVRSISILPNSSDRDAIKKIVKTVKEGNSILIFPEGTRSRTNGKDARREKRDSTIGKTHQCTNSTNGYLGYRKIYAY